MGNTYVSLIDTSLNRCETQVNIIPDAQWENKCDDLHFPYACFQAINGIIESVLDMQDIGTNNY